MTISSMAVVVKCLLLQGSRRRPAGFQTSVLVIENRSTILYKKAKHTCNLRCTYIPGLYAGKRKCGPKAEVLGCELSTVDPYGTSGVRVLTGLLGSVERVKYRAKGDQTCAQYPGGASLWSRHISS